MKKDKIVATRIDEELFRLLEAKAEASGYNLVSDYLRDLIIRDLKSQERTLDVEAVSKAVVSSVESRLLKLERVVVDLLNPYTGKIDRVTAQLSTLQEMLEEIRDMLQQLRQQPQIRQPTSPYAARDSRGWQERGRWSGQRERGRGEQRGGRVTAIELLRENGVTFEEDVRGQLRNPDSFFARLEREGAIVFYLDNGMRIAVYPDFLDELIEKVRELDVEDREALARYLTEKEARLFNALVDAGIIYYDALTRQWMIHEKYLKEQ